MMPMHRFLKMYQRFLYTFLLAISPSLAFASSFAVTTYLNDLVTLLQSDVAKVVFVLAIVGIGYGWLWLGRIPKERAMGSIIGIGLVFSASYIAQQFGLG